MRLSLRYARDLPFGVAHSCRAWRGGPCRGGPLRRPSSNGREHRATRVLPRFAVGIFRDGELSFRPERRGRCRHLEGLQTGPCLSVTRHLGRGRCRRRKIRESCGKLPILSDLFGLQLGHNVQWSRPFDFSQTDSERSQLASFWSVLLWFVLKGYAGDRQERVHPFIVWQAPVSRPLGHLPKMGRCDTPSGGGFVTPARDTCCRPCGTGSLHALNVPSALCAVILMPLFDIVLY